MWDDGREIPKWWATCQCSNCNLARDAAAVEAVVRGINNRRVKESAMSGVNSSLIGQRTTTWNKFINTLPEGTILEVVNQSPEDGAEVEVLDVLTDPPAEVKSFAPGDRINTKHGPATVLRLTNRLDAEQAGMEDGDILYLADGTNVARVAQREEVSAL